MLAPVRRVPEVVGQELEKESPGDQQVAEDDSKVLEQVAYAVPAVACEWAEDTSKEQEVWEALGDVALDPAACS